MSSSSPRLGISSTNPAALADPSDAFFLDLRVLAPPLYCSKEAGNVKFMIAKALSSSSGDGSRTASGLVGGTAGTERNTNSRLVLGGRGRVQGDVPHMAGDILSNSSQVLLLILIPWPEIHPKRTTQNGSY